MDGLSTVGSGLLADERWQQVVMNNLTNATTPGFKQSSGELMAFPQQLLMRYELGSDGQGATPLGTVNRGALFQEAVPDFVQGSIESTGQPLDLAIQDPAVAGTSVYAQATGAGAVPGAVQLANTLSFVVGRGGVIETAAGAPIVPVAADGSPLAGARVIANSSYHGLQLFGEDGSPVVDAAGQPSYHIVLSDGQVVGPVKDGQPGPYVQMSSAVTGGVHSFFAVANTAADGQTSVAMTRDGQFHMGSDQLLYDGAGQRVLAVSGNGQPLLQSAIELNPAYQGQSVFGPDGAPLVDGAGQPSYRIVDAATGAPLANATFAPVAVNVDTLQALGQTGYLPTATTAYSKSPATVQAGAIERSNVDSTQNMVNMLQIYRNFEANQTLTQDIDSTLKLAVSSIGSVPNL